MRLFVDDYLQVRYVNLNVKKVRNQLKLLVVGDVHISDNISFEKINLIIKRIVLEKADYVFFTGDLIDSVDDIYNGSSILKLKKLLDGACNVSKVFIILGNHDYIHRKTHDSYLNDVILLFARFDNVILLNDEIYKDDNIWLMGYTQKKEYYGDKIYDFQAFYDDFSKHKLLYKKVDKQLLDIALIHSPEFIEKLENKQLLNNYDLIICGHTHDGCIPFGFGNFKRGIISPKKKFFPKNVRGIRNLGNNYILITGGITKIQNCAAKLLQPFNHLCPMQIDVITFNNKKDVEIRKKWY